ncbi:DUF2884 family protein [Vibrio viridaestus]|nr:DUF2884 family protein [Vibrio viridaestus]
MTRFLLFISIIFSPISFAGQCHVQLKSEIQHNDDSVNVIMEDGRVATIYNDSRLVIDGKEHPLTSEQHKFLEAYQKELVSSVNQIESYTAQSIKQIDLIIDDISSSLGESDSLETLRQRMHTYWQQASESFYGDDGFSIDNTSMSTLDEAIEKMQSLFDHEFISSLWDAASDGVDKLSELSFSEFTALVQELNNKIYEHWQRFSQDKEKRQKEVCDSFNQLIDQEQSLHKSIPELRNYQVFTI